MKFHDSNNKCNLYIRYEPVYNLATYLNKSSYLDNIYNSRSIFHKNLNVQMYLTDYIERIKNKKRNYKNKKNIEAQSLEILIPKELHIKDDKKIIKKIINEVVLEFSNGIKVKYFSSTKKEGNLIFLKVIIFDRNFYPTGKLIKKYHKSDWFADKRGIRRNPSTYTGGDELKLIHSKGEEYEQIIYVSEKIRFTGFANLFEGENSKIIFESNFQNLKTIMMNIMSNHGIKFKKINCIFKMETYKRLIKKNGKWLYIHKSMDVHNIKYYYKIRKKQLINTLIYQINKLQFQNDAFKNENLMKKIQKDFEAIRNKILNVKLKNAEILTTDILYQIKARNIWFEKDILTVDEILKITNSSTQAKEFISSEIFG